MTSTSTRDLVSQPYKYGFVTDIETEKIAKGLSEEVVRLISSKKKEPKFLLDFRLKAYRHWLKLQEPDWAALGYKAIDYQDIVYYAAPKQQEKKQSLDEVDPKLLETFEKLGIPLSEQKRLSNVAVDAVFDSVSIATTYREKLAEHGVVFCSFTEAVKDHPELKPYRTEWTIYDEDLKISGSIDMIYENPDGTLSIYDWKFIIGNS